MSLTTEFSISFKYLRAKKKEALISITAWLALLGIMLGVAALVVVMSVMNGYRIELTSKLKGCNSDITVTGQPEIANYKGLLKRLGSVQDIRAIFPLIESQGLITFDKTSKGVIIKALADKSLATYPILADSARNPNAITRPNGILLGRNLAFALGVGPGDTVRVVSPEFTTTLVGAMPNTKDFYVEGLFRSGLNDYDGVYAIVPLKIGQIFFGMPDSVNKLEIFTKSEANLRTTSMDIAAITAGKYSVQNWQTANRFLFHALRTERTVMFIILTFIILVAVFNIISSLTMLVLCKAREVAILRTIGFTRWSIMRIFMICGSILGGLGTAAGIGLGLLFALHINPLKNFLSRITGTDLFNPIVYYLDTLPSHVESSDVTRIAVTALILTVLATLYPSYKASKMHPAQGLKND